MLWHTILHALRLIRNSILGAGVESDLGPGGRPLESVFCVVYKAARLDPADAVAGIPAG